MSSKELVFVVAAGSLLILYILWKRRQTPTNKMSQSQGNDVVVAKVNDMKDGEMKAVKVHDTSILLIKDKGAFCAVGNTCTHLSAPLNTGTYLNGTVRCPWHGACFNTTTGDIEDFPGVLNIPTFKVKVQGEDVVISATPEEVAVKKVAPRMAKKTGNDARTFVIVGAGAAGATAAFELRASGFEGRVVLIGAEKHLPYDRTKLSKSMTMSADKLALRPQSDYTAQDIELMLGLQVVKLNADEKVLLLSNDQKLSYDACLVATGAIPVRLERFIKGNEVPHKNVYVLRTADEGPRIQAASEKKRVAIVGSSFIGVETAASLAPVATSVVVIGMEKVPFERVLGEEVGGILQKLHETKNIKFIMNAICSEFKVEDDNVHSIVLKDGTVVECDVVIIGAGVTPCTQFVEGSQIKKHQDQTIITNEYLESAPGLFVAGDLARWPLPILDNELVRIEHWGIAQTMGKVAAKNMVNKVKTPMKSVPVFWTASYGKSVRYAGHGIGVDQTMIDYFGSNIDPANPKFVAYYAKKGKVIAISSMNADPVVSDFAQLLASGVSLQISQLAESIKQGKSTQYIHSLVSAACCPGHEDKKNK